MQEAGQNTILLLAVVPDIPETAHNIVKAMNVVGISKVPYKLTGDLKFLNMSFGLQSCSALYPCVFCTGKRQKGEWTEGQLWTFGTQRKMYNGWVANGSHYSTAATSKFQSTIGLCLVQSVGDTDDTTFLLKIGMPTVQTCLH